MARLPQPGTDDGVWGDILNQFLLTEHNADGTHKDAAFIDASPTHKGKIQLAGDVSGTADLPTVVGLQTYPIATDTPGDQQVLTWSGGNGWWYPSTPLSPYDPQWNANLLQGVSIDTTTPNDGQILRFDGNSGYWTPVNLPSTSLPTDHLGTISPLMLKYRNASPAGAYWDTLGNDLPVLEAMYAFEYYYDDSANYVLSGSSSTTDRGLTLPNARYDAAQGNVDATDITTFTAQKYGLYHFEFHTVIPSFSSGSCYFAFKINSSDIPVAGTPVNTVPANCGYSVSADIYLQSGDTVTVVMHQYVTASYNFTLNGPKTRFSGRLMTGPGSVFI